MALKQYSCCRPYKNVYPSRAKWKDKMKNRRKHFGVEF
ncbi:hypothetical protein BVRB_5g104460 isoform B [Beta vulgaris subsp. vulgaris]|uniref:Uncharacterized protein n=1 Tax=Beta vulgaris subsp. vulgaris TaxID=3555 RepID=A0A0J8CIG9_BETVV|nr:hypothetical protein BVRB_5g104460 isoform B [Beta vulgaris subsp. vulgaris]